MSDLTGLLKKVCNSNIPWYITIPVPASVASIQKRRQNFDSADAILPTPWLEVSSANSRSKAPKDGLFLFIVSSGRVGLDLVSASIFQISVEDDLDANSMLKTNKFRLVSSMEQNRAHLSTLSKLTSQVRRKLVCAECLLIRALFLFIFKVI